MAISGKFGHSTIVLHLYPVSPVGNRPIWCFQVYLSILSTSICFEMCWTCWGRLEHTTNVSSMVWTAPFSVPCTLPGCHWLDWERDILCCFLSEIVLCIRLGSAHQSGMFSVSHGFSLVSHVFSHCRWCWAGQLCLESLHAVSQLAEKPGRVWSRPSAPMGFPQLQTAPHGSPDPMIHTSTNNMIHTLEPYPKHDKMC